MKISKAELRKIILEEPSIVKKAGAKLKEGLHDEGLREMISDFLSNEIPRWHDEAKADLQGHVEANGFDLSQEVLQALSVGGINEGMDVEQDLELQTKTVLNNGGGIQDVGTAIEQAGYKVRRTNSVILVDTPDGTYGIASTSKVDLDGTEAIIQGIGGTELAIGRMSQ